MCICIVAALRQCKYMKYNGRWAQEQSLIFLASVPKCVQAGVLHLGAVRLGCSVKLASLPVYATYFGFFTTRKSSRNVHESFHEAIVKSPFAGCGWPSKGFVRPSEACKRRFLHDENRGVTRCVVRPCRLSVCLESDIRVLSCRVLRCPDGLPDVGYPACKRPR